MSPLSSRLRSVLALVVMMVVFATVLTPIAADAQGERTLVANVTVDAPAVVGHNEDLSWKIDVLCQAEAGECGNTIIESQLSSGVAITDVDVSLAPGYVVVQPERDELLVDQPVALQFQRAGDLLDSETVTFVIHGRVGPNAVEGIALDHTVLVGSTNTSPVSAVAPAAVVGNAASWNVQGFDTGEATIGRNETHRVAVCGSTQANVDHGDLVLDLALPVGTVVIDAAEADETPTGLRWSIPAVSTQDLADEHVADLDAGRVPELCHEYFPAIRWASPDFGLGETVPVALTLGDAAGGSVDGLCPLGCRLDAAPVLVASTTVIEAEIVGPDTVNAGGLASWAVTFDASATAEDVQVPLLDIALPVGLQLERVDVSGLGAGVEAQIHPSIDGAASYAPESVRTSELGEAVIDRAAFDNSVGAEASINALQIRFVSPAGEPLLAAGHMAEVVIVTSPDPLQSIAGSGELCAMATSATAASLSGRSCHLATVTDAAPVFGPVGSSVIAAPPTQDQVVTTTVQVPEDNGATIINPIVGALLPAGFEFRGLDGVAVAGELVELPAPRVETLDDYNGTGRTLVQFRWDDSGDGHSASHSIDWTPSQMRAAGQYRPLAIEIAWRIAAPGGHPAGSDALELAVTSASTPPVNCPAPSVLRDDALGLGTAFVCAHDASTETASGASLEQQNLVAGVPLLPFVSTDPVTTWCETTRLDDVDWTSAPCAAPTTPNGRVQFRTDVTNTGNRNLVDVWSYGMLPQLGDVGIDPDTWQTPRASEFAASLTGPLVVSGLDWEPVEPGDIEIEYSSAADPCRTELSDAAMIWPTGCSDDWTATPQRWEDVTAWRVNVPFARTPFAGGTSFQIEGELLAAADAAFDTTATAAVAHAAFDPVDAAWTRTGSEPIEIIVPPEAEITAADPALLPHDLALIATLDAEASVALHDGPDAGDDFVVDIEVLNQGAPVDAIDVALHPTPSVAIESASGSLLTDSGNTIGWSVTAGSPAIVSLTGSLSRADNVTIPVPASISEGWVRSEWTQQPLHVIAEISRFDAAGSTAALIDHDSVADLDPANDVAPDAPDDEGDNVVTGDGQPDSGVEPDPVGDDEDDHDIAGVPIWDLGIDVALADGQDPLLDWAAPTATFEVTVSNDGNRSAYDVVIEQDLPAGMQWVQTGQLIDASVDQAPSLVVDENGRATISHLAPDTSATWHVTTSAFDPAFYDFAFEATIAGFSSDAAPDTVDSALVLDVDGDDLTGAAAAALPWDIAVGLDHRSTDGLPLGADTKVVIDLTIENAGRALELAVVDINLANAGLIADSPDLAVPVLDALGRPVRVTWDLSDATRPRIQVERSDGASFEHGARVVVPLELSVADPALDPNTIEIEAILSGFSAAAENNELVPFVDADERNDTSQVVVPMWDLALSFADGTPMLTTVDDEVVASWTVLVENQGNRNATDIVVEVGFGERLQPIADAPVVVPFLAAGEQIELVVQSRFIDGYDGSFAATAQIVSMADENRQQRGDADSRPGLMAAPAEGPEDDEQRLERSLPAAVELAADHVATSTLPVVPGESTISFDITVRNVGRPVHVVLLLLDTGGFGPVVVDADAVPFGIVPGAVPGSLILELPDNAPLMPDAVMTLPVTLSIPQDWDGTIPSLTVVATEGESASVEVTMSVWDLALDVELAAGQPERIDPAAPTNWELTVLNEGNRDAHAVSVAVTLPDGMAFVDIEGPGASSPAPQGQTGEIIVELDRVVAGDSASVILRSELTRTDRTSFRLGAEILAFDTDTDPSNDPNPLAGDIDSTPRSTVQSPGVGGSTVGQASLSVAEDDQDHADAALAADVQVVLGLDPSTPPRAGADSTWTLSATNQGVDLAQATVVFSLDERWTLTDPATLPATTSGAVVLAAAWDLSDPTAPRATLTGSWPSGAALELPFTLGVEPAASAGQTPLAIGAAIESIDDDGFPATPSPELDDVDDDRSTEIELDLFDLALRVRIDPTVALPPAPESEVIFLVEVTNQGTVAASDIAVRLHLDTTQWLPLAEPAITVADAATALEPGATRAVPVTLLLAPDADLTAASLIAEIATASGIDFDSTADDDATNDSAPDAPGAATDDALNNLDGDEDDHDIASLQPPTWVLGNQVWFDTNRDGMRDEGEPAAEGVLLELMLDANGDGVADDRDLSGTIDQADRVATATTDADGLFRFDRVGAGQYLIAIPPSEFTGQGPLAGWSTTIQTTDGADGTNDGRLRSDGGVTSSTIVVAGTAPIGELPNNADDLPDTRTDLTIDFGLGQWSLGNQVWFDTIENGLFDAGEEEGVGGARLHLFVDANQDGTADDVNADGVLTIVDALSTTTADPRGRYRFDGLGAGTYIVAVADTTMRGQLGDWAISRFSRSVEPDRDNDSNAASWSGEHVLSAPIRLGAGPQVDLTLDLGFELAEVAPIVWPDVDLTGFNNPAWSLGGNQTTFFGPDLGDDLTGFDAFGDVDIFEGDDPFGFDEFDFVDDAFFEGDPGGPLAYTGANSRTLVSWAAMLIVFGAVLVGVSRDPDED